MDPASLTLTPAATATLAGPAVTAPATTADPTAARKAAQDFESFFLSQSFESMFDGVDTKGLFGGGEGENIYRSLLLQEYSKVAAKSGGVGIADAVQREILRQQEAK
ncbi:MAG TPA: rod-binding protein [Stellaceae bacterium]|nr:rod-binding protein [Stellaceae bacterium]